MDALDFAGIYATGLPEQQTLAGPFHGQWGWLWVLGDDEGIHTVKLSEDEQLAVSPTALGVRVRIGPGPIAAAVSYWSQSPPDGAGLLVADVELVAPQCEIQCTSTEGRNEGVLVLPEDRKEVRVRVWRRPVPEDGGVEQFDVRVWPLR